MFKSKNLKHESGALEKVLDPISLNRPKSVIV